MAAVLLAHGSVMAQQSNTVFVYNGGLTGYDADAEGLAWQGAGFLDARGAPLRFDNMMNIINAQNQIVGARITNMGGDVVGWRNATTSVSIFNLNVGANTFRAAFENVANNGTLNILKHGLQRDQPVRRGGGVMLDRGNYFSGFNPTPTGVRTSNPYPALPNRAGANLTFNFVTCWADNDPDGPRGAEISVTRSARGIPGVAAATGPRGESHLGIEMSTQWLNAPPLFNNLTVEQITARVNAARDQLPAVTNGRFRNFHDYLASLPFADRARRAQEVTSVRILNGTGQAGNITVQIDLSYINETQLPLSYINATRGRHGEGTTIYIDRDFPFMVPSATGCRISYLTPSTMGGGARVDLTSLTDSDWFPDFEALHLGRRAELPAPEPAGLTLLSGIYALSATDGLLELAAGNFTVDLVPFTEFNSLLSLYALQGSNWLPLTGSTDDPALFTLTAPFTAAGVGNAWETSSFVVAAFGVPAPCNLDFETDACGDPTYMNHGLDLATSGPECSFVCPLITGGPSGGNGNAGAALFDSETSGGTQDLDLQAPPPGQGNILILQNNNQPVTLLKTGVNGPDTYDHPNDDQDGGTLTFDFCPPLGVEAQSLDLIDIDLPAPDQDSSVVLTDINGFTRTYTVPAGWTADGGVGTLDLKGGDQMGPGGSTATVFTQAGYDETNVIQIRVTLGSSGAIDNLRGCPGPPRVPAGPHIQRYPQAPTGTGTGPGVQVDLPR